MCAYSQRKSPHNREVTEMVLSIFTFFHWEFKLQFNCSLLRLVDPAAFANNFIFLPSCIKTFKHISLKTNLILFITYCTSGSWNILNLPSKFNPFWSYTKFLLFIQIYYVILDMHSILQRIKKEHLLQTVWCPGMLLPWCSPSSCCVIFAPMWIAPIGIQNQINLKDEHNNNCKK